MSNIKSTDTQIEIQVRHWIYQHRIRYRKNLRSIEGKPDIAIAKYRIAIFVNGCFWHGHENCKYYRIPKTENGYWKEKIENNKLRDLKVYGSLKNKGWNVFVIWECQIKENFDENINALYQNIMRIIQMEKPNDYSIS